MGVREFDKAFRELTGHPPFPWQTSLYGRFVSGDPPASWTLPTGLGKTSVIAIWLLALAQAELGRVRRRLVYVVNRRTVVDQATREAENLRSRLGAMPTVAKMLASLCAVDAEPPLAISTLRGQFADNGEWYSDPTRPAVIVGTVDMIGSRLLFSGYGRGFKSRPLHAGFLGQDALLVHDEAHLEPAFQTLVEGICAEQARESTGANGFGALRVMALTATPRGTGAPFDLTAAEKEPPEHVPAPPTEPLHIVWKRLKATKQLHLRQAKDDAKIAEQIGDLALKQHKASNAAVLIFVRTLDDVAKVCHKLTNKETGVPTDNVQQLTGTMRGLERDRMADPRRPDASSVFARFLRPPKADAPEAERWKTQPRLGTVYLVCTSAGEVGIDISADHMVCDLSTFESMAQRCGRVNRFGDRKDTRIDVVHPAVFGKRDKKTGKVKSNKLDNRLEKTLKLLQVLPPLGSNLLDARPAALASLDLRARLAAFTPTPTIVPATDILFDAWAMTSIRDRLPARPPVEPYLHGISEWEPPQTQVAWRDEVAMITDDLVDRYVPHDLLDDYPLKPHELLRDRSKRVFEELKALANEHGDTAAWLIDDLGAVERVMLSRLVDEGLARIANRTVVLPPSVGGLAGGLLKGKASWSEDAAYDIADHWLDEASRPRRCRSVWDDDRPPNGMRLVRVIDIRPDADEDQGAEGEPSPRRFWRWYVRPRSADDDGSRSSQKPVAWATHAGDVVATMERFTATLGLPGPLAKALAVAARSHDLGKRREVFQRGLGNRDPSNPWAKSGGHGRFRDGNPDYRHEFGSLLDVQADADFQGLDDDMKDVVLHLIASHHGHARPHFPVRSVFDPEARAAGLDATAVDVPCRFARLQRRYGRWGLAYLESLLRAADYAASASPSAFINVHQEDPS